MKACKAWTDHYKSGVKEGIKEGILTGKAEGIKEGEIKGKLEGKIEFIANLHKANFPIEQIAELANEDVEFVKKHLAS